MCSYLTLVIIIRDIASVNIFLRVFENILREGDCLKKKIIAQRLVNLMDSQGLNPTEFSKITGINRSTLEGYIKATSLLKIDSLIAICEKFNISADYILDIEFASIEKDVPSEHDLSEDQEKIISYYNRLDDENKDYIKGEMIRLYREQEIKSKDEQMSLTLEKHA